MAKLDALIAVLEVARTKAEQGRTMPGADVQRLERVEGNLSRTLTVCRRARTNLRNGAAAPEIDAEADQRLQQESISAEAYERMRKSAPIRREDSEGLDIDLLCQRLIEDWPEE